MSVQVGNLAEDEECQTGVHESGVGIGCRGGSVGAEDPVGDVEAGEGPVVSAVLEDVAGRHGCVAEAVDEDGLILALEEVNGQESTDEELGVGGVGEGLIVVEVKQRAEGEEEESWDEEGTQVFDDEDGAPCDLRTYRYQLLAL